MSIWYVRDVCGVLGVSCMVFSIELNAMNLLSLKEAPSLQRWAAHSLIDMHTNPLYKEKIDLLLSDKEDIDRLLGSYYCTMHLQESWAALPTVKKITLDMKMVHVKTVIPLKNERLIVVDKSGKLCLVEIGLSPRVVYQKYLHSGARNPEKTINSFVVSSDQRYGLSASSEGDVSVWLLHNGELIKTFSHPASVLRATFNSTMSKVLTGSIDNFLCVWDYEEEKCLSKIQCKDSVPRSLISLTFLVDDRYVAIAETNYIRRWDREKDEVVKALEVKRKRIGSFAALCPDGFMLSAGVSSDTMIGSIDEGAKAQDYSNAEKGCLSALAVSSNKQFLATSCSENDSDSKILHKILLSSVPDAPKEDGNSAAALVYVNKIPLPTNVTALAFSADNQSLFYGSYDGSFGVISFTYLASLLRLKEAKLVISIIKKILMGEPIVLQPEEESCIASLDKRIKNALKVFFVTYKVSSECIISDSV